MFFYPLKKKKFNRKQTGNSNKNRLSRFRFTPVNRSKSTNNREPESINSIISSDINDVFCELRAHLQ